MNNKILKLKSGREKAIKHQNFWIFSGAVASSPTAERGETITIQSASGDFLAHGSWSPDSQIRARAWSFNKAENIDVEFFRRRLKSAMECRELANITAHSSGYRLVAAEGDSLPGIVIDRYNDILVVQLLSAGSDYMRETLVEALRLEFPEVTGIYERSDVAVRTKEGLTEVTGVLYGNVPEEPIVITEHGMKLLVDVRNGHKTGFYCDQRANRKLVGELAKGKSVLNLFSYTGGFGVSAALGGAKSIENVDSSSTALELASQNMSLNGISNELYTNTVANVFELLREYKKAGKKFDMIILDPPKLVEAQAHLMKGARAYKELAMQAFRLLNNGGMLLTFSCSGLVSADLFAKITFDAAFDANCSGNILQRLTQDCDHPVRLSHPESSYLKGVLVVKQSI